MSARSWTTEQRQCIEARGGTVLVSAAAGSGKTSVLVQRVIGLITDPDHPLGVDRLLVVTFTKAAAAEMKQRLSAELTELISRNPEDRRLQRQQLLLPRANFSTVHGFCANLLREYFHLLDLSPQFKVAEEAETALLQEEALQEVLEEHYRQKEPVFLELAALLGSGRDDKGLVQTVRRIYSFVQSHPFPGQWLAEKEAAFETDTPLPDTPWGRIVLDSAADTLRYAASLLRKARRIAAEEPKMEEAYGGVLERDAESLEAAAASLAGCSWDACAGLLDEAASFGRLGVLRKYEDEQRKERVKALRDEARKRVKELPGTLCGAEAECREDMAAVKRLVSVLFTLVRQFGDRFAEKKKKRRMVDFNDLEHGALRLLIQRDEDGAIRRTPLARELSERFDEVLVDEYQDTNAAQDALFSALSREEANLFMVGDVKQSIYGFRQAMPEIFIRRRDSYPPYDGAHYPASITLGNNFRSRVEVTEAVNFVFRQLMTREAGGIAYDDREALLPSAVYPPGGDCAAELLLVDSSLNEEEDTRDAAEARVIAMRIKALMESFPVTEKGAARPARYGDFCILLRSKAAHAAAYAEELGRCGIPAWTATSAGFFSAPEIAVALSLLRVIDNPLLDVPLLAVLFSPVYGFTPDELAAIRLPDRHAPLYAALRAMSKGREAPLPGLKDKCAVFLADMERYRTLAATLPADRLIHRLYEESGMLAVAGARRHGPQRVANLRLLHDYARRFEQNGFRGLSAFIRYIDRLEQQHMDLAPASTVSEHADVVRIMSIHNSKGLEFPVVFLAGMGGLFNPDSTKGDLLLHPQAGIGLVRRDPETLRQINTLSRQAVSLAIRKSERAEELRVLYVAMTRAKEKLLMTMSVKDPSAKLNRLAAALGKEEALPSYLVLSARSMSDWVLSAALRHPSGEHLRRLADSEDLAVLPAAHPWNISVVRAPAPAKAEQAEVLFPPADAPLYRMLAQRLQFRYPFESFGKIPAKLGASEASPEPTGSAFVATQRPAFLGRAGLTPAERGTALHTFMQFASFEAAAVDPQAEVRRLVEREFLTPQQGDSIPLEKVERFFGSRLYQRIKASPRCMREYPFTIGIPAARFLPPDALPPESAAAELVVIQGIADCVFQEKNGLVIVDYKTDRVKTPLELAERYRQQLHIYAYALQRILELPVRQCILYSFALSCEIPLPVPDQPPAFA